MTQAQARTINKLDIAIRQQQAKLASVNSTSYFYFEIKASLERIQAKRTYLLTAWLQS